MSAFNLTNLMANTKQALVDYILKQSTELAQLRVQLSEATVLVQALKAERPTPVAEETREHEYATVVDAMNHCRQLVAWDVDRRYQFVVRGTKVICKIRRTH